MSIKVLDELHTLALNVTLELWGPSPVVPDPICPGGQGAALLKETHGWRNPVAPEAGHGSPIPY